MATEGTDAIEEDSAVTRVGVIAAVLVDLRPEWADRHQALVGAVLVDLREVLAAVDSVDLRVDSAAVSVGLPVVLEAVTAKAGSAQ